MSLQAVLAFHGQHVVATRREGHRSLRSGRAVPHRQWPGTVGQLAIAVPKAKALSVALGPEARSGHDKSTMAGRDAAD
jgi:hypothetical protein